MRDSAVSALEPGAVGSVFNVQRCSLHDGPGIRTTVFFKGCPLSCTWCHNPEGIARDPDLTLSVDRCIGCGACVDVCPRVRDENLSSAPVGRRSDCLRCGRCVDACPADARSLSGKTYGVSELIDLVERDRPFFETSGGGVTFSGGEPTSQPDFLVACLRASRERGLHTAIDTCGAAPLDVVLEVALLADLFLFDLKHMDPDAHRRSTGVDNRLILENLGRLSAAGAEIWLRVPFVPGINDDVSNLDAVGAFVSSLPRRHPVVLLPYHAIAKAKASRIGQADTFTQFASPDADALEHACHRLGSFGLEVAVGGRP
jgi:pyruvate formate lyase activating enzyme